MSLRSSVFESSLFDLAVVVTVLVVAGALSFATTSKGAPRVTPEVVSPNGGSGGPVQGDFLSKMEREPEWSFNADLGNKLKSMGVECTVEYLFDNGIHEQSGSRWVTVACEGEKALLLEVSTPTVQVFSCFDPSVPAKCLEAFPPVVRYSI